MNDLSDKVKRAIEVDGPAFINVLSTCKLGWRHEPKDAVSIARLAVDTLFWPLYEVVKGRFRITHFPEKAEPIETWLQLQGRFKHLFKEENEGVLDIIQKQIDDEWERLNERDRNDRAHFAPIEQEESYTTSFEMVS